MKTMKQYGFYLFVVGFLFVGCGKEPQYPSRLRLMAEDMNHGYAKVSVNPDDVSGSASWIAGECIDLNGSAYGIAYDDGYYLNTGDADLEETLYAIYPATTDAGGNDITVTNNPSGASSIVIRSLAVNFHGDVHDVVFPMATGAVDRDGGKLLFKHVTGGFRLTLTDTNSARDYTVGSLRVVAYGDGAAPAPAVDNTINVTTSWALQGPVLPGGEVGQITGNPSAAYASEMHFTLMSDGDAGKAIPHNASISFYVPVTVASVKTLEVTGYSTTGAQLFFRTKTLDNALTVQPNYIYNIPEIQF